VKNPKAGFQLTRNERVRLVSSFCYFGLGVRICVVASFLGFLFGNVRGCYGGERELLDPSASVEGWDPSFGLRSRDDVVQIQSYISYIHPAYSSRFSMTRDYKVSSRMSVDISATSLFNVAGLVAVVTGGGTGTAIQATPAIRSSGLISQELGS
jgi:hypothetical protein